MSAKSTRCNVLHFFFLIILSLFASITPTCAQGEVYVTRQGFEVDKLASIWLIKRFVDTQAEFIFIANTDKKDRGIPFDIPGASLRRFSNHSTFETILKHYQIHDQNLQFIGQLIHDIEINTWEKKRFKETLGVQLAIGMIIKKGGKSEEVVSRGKHYFDTLYDSLRRP